MNSRTRAARIIERLHDLYPQANCTLDYQEPWHLLAGAILASQCTDARVNKITPLLFRRYPDLVSLAAASYDDLAGIIRSCGLFRSKARSLIGMAKMITEKHNGQIPADRDSLMQLPGVGRKIANLVLGDYFAWPAIVVDTHCGRISRLLGLTDSTSPVQIEKDLERVIDRQEWINYGHLMVSHGRNICMARNPQCDRCPLRDLCRYARNNSIAGKEEISDE